MTEVAERSLLWTVNLPFDRPLSLNDRPGNAMVNYRLRTMWREKAAKAFLAAGIPHCERVRLSMAYVPKVNRRHDPDNLVASMKPIADALVDAGIVADDTEEYVERIWPTFLPKERDREGGRVIVMVEPLA